MIGIRDTCLGQNPMKVRPKFVSVLNFDALKICAPANDRLA